MAQLSCERLEPVVERSVCKICRGQAPLHGVADFNKSCEEHRGRYLPLVGVPIYYHRCGQCGLVFTHAFDRWDKQAYRTHIYNNAYVTVDPDYLEARPSNNATLVENFIGSLVGNLMPGLAPGFAPGLTQQRGALQCLDYGGGSGRLAALLRERGVAASSWDPLAAEDTVQAADRNPEPPRGAFDLVTAFEVLEHTPDPLGTAEQALGLLGPRGVMLFSTLTLGELPPRAMHHWYIAPRNGHITIHTAQSLQVLFATFGFRVHHFNHDLHLAWREAPGGLS